MGRRNTTRFEQAVNRRVLLRDHGLCQLRLPGTWTTRTGQGRHCMGRADCVHHTRGYQVTGSDPAYMVAACTPCNQRVGEPEREADPAPRPATQW